MKYNTGDKVKLVDTYTKKIPMKMRNYLGKIVTINKCCDEAFTIQEDDSFFWNYNMVDKLINTNFPDEFLKEYYSDFINDDISGFTSIMNIEYLKGKYDKCVHRDDEINRLCEILLRKNKCNPVLTGTAGIGKTAIVEGFVSKITEIKKKSLEDSNLANHPLVNKVVFNVNLTSMIAGMKYRGDFEERLRKVVKIAKSNSDVILFIDEIHTIVGLNKDNEDTISLGQLLKEPLSRGDISVIGATTETEYELIKKDKALDRRFVQINVKEFTKSQMKSILSTICETYSKYHNISISSDVMKSALEYCNSFLDNRTYPDKLIDVIDETAARIRLWRYEDKNLAMTIDDICKTISNMTGKIIVNQ